MKKSTPVVLHLPSFLPAILWTLLSALPAGAVQDRPATEKPQEVTEIDLEDLMKVQVTTAGRKEQSQTEVPAALYVIRSEDIRRTGVTSIAEALRRVPGLQVGRSDANTWAVSARGFTSSSSSKQLVLIDGRSVYSPLHSGVFWDVQDVFLEDVDRIEVIRGPGGAVWGANAVNGIINVITKNASQTGGGFVYGGGGFEERHFAGARYGFKAGDDLDVRVYAKYFDRDDAVQDLDPDEDAFDDLFMARAGFRSDWKAGEKDRVTFQGDLYQGEAQERLSLPQLTAPFALVFHDRTELAGGNLIWRWEREFDATSSLSLQVYYDHTLRSNEAFKETLDTGDLDFQHRFSPLDGHDVVWGLGYRIYRSDLEDGFFLIADPEERTDDLPSAFVQDEIVLLDKFLKLTLGCKFEHNDYSGFEVQPSARMAWTPDENHLVWMSATRAVRTPSILDTDLRLNALVFPGPTVFTVFGTDDFRSEEVISYEAGYRSRPWDPLQVSVAFFYNDYDELRSLEPGPSFSETDPPPTHTVLPFFIENELEGRTYGAEASVNLQAASWWLIQATYAHIYLNLDPTSSSADTTSEAEERRSPRNQAWVRSAMDLPENFALDVVGRYVSRIPAIDADAYFEADVRLAWTDPTRGLEVALVGQNLVHEHHEELGSGATGSKIERGGYLSVSLRF